MYEYNYDGGKLTTHSLVQQKPTQAATNGRGNDAQKTLQCIDWFWVTTYADGTQDWEFLYTTCDGCDQTFIDCGGGGGGGEIYEQDDVMSPRQIEWTVAESTNNYWRITSTEEFNGVRRRSTGGYFTTVTHKRDGIFSSAGYTWTPTEINVTGNNSYLAQSSIKGYGNFGGVQSPVDGIGRWTFEQVFP